MKYDVQVTASAMIVKGVLTEAAAFSTHSTSATTALAGAVESLPNSANAGAAISAFSSVTVAPTVTAIHDGVELAASETTVALVAYAQGDGAMAATSSSARGQTQVGDMPGRGHRGAR